MNHENPMWSMFRDKGGSRTMVKLNPELAAEWQRQWHERHAANWVDDPSSKAPGNGQRGTLVPR